MCDLPSDWSETKLRKAAQKGGLSFTDGDWIEASYIASSGIRLLQTGNIGRGFVNDKTGTRRYISLQTFGELGCKWVRHGDILICRLADPIGRACEVPEHLDKSITSVDVTILKVDSLEYIPRYVLHYLNSEINLKLAADRAGGSTRSRISRSNLGHLPLPKPPLAQQQKIAEVLDTLDTQIHKTEALIAKLEKVKEGLLHDLLTRGIDESGRLRPSPEQAPELYKESPLGLIPREWEARPLSTVVKGVTPGAAIKSGEFSDAGKPVIAKSDVTGSKLIDIENRDQFVSFQAASLYSRSMADEGAVIVSLRDLVPSGPTVGMGSIFYGKGTYILAQGTYGLYLKEGLMTREFFCEMTRRSWFRSQARGITVGSTQVHARSSEYVGIIIPSPALHEQIAINEMIRSLDDNISIENRTLSDTADLKIGLMDDLLTGRVRVTPLLDQAQATTPA